MYSSTNFGQPAAVAGGGAAGAASVAAGTARFCCPQPATAVASKAIRTTRDNEASRGLVYAMTGNPPDKIHELYRRADHTRATQLQHGERGCGVNGRRLYAGAANSRRINVHSLVRVFSIRHDAGAVQGRSDGA